MKAHFTASLLLALAPLFGFATAAHAAAQPDYDALAKATRETLALLVTADTTNPPGNEARAVKIVADKLKAAGIEYRITEFAPGRQNIVARIAASGDFAKPKPLLLLAHSDVVTADGQNWTVPPHQLTERGKYVLGRGVSDMLGMAAAELELFLWLKKSSAPLSRDVIFALTGDEESNGTGIVHVLKQDPASLEAAIALNEGGGIMLDEKTDKPLYVMVQGAEKTYQDFELVAKSEPGHSSMPLDDNAIYRLAGALQKVEKHREPARLIPVTRGYFEGRARFESPRIGAAMLKLVRAKGSSLPADALKVIESEPQLRIQLRTTCVATTLKGGTRVNALPAEATANINCRILPDETVEQTRATLARVIGDPRVEVRVLEDSGHGPASPTATEKGGEAAKAIARVARKMWPSIAVLPVMDSGASDSRYLRQRGVAAYGISPLPAYESDDFHVHGVDERVPTASFRPGVEFLHRVVMEIAGSGA
jgi:acetylornithine deacetylase/succinyl-diaminopimelate desuccinylase-like protein